MPRILTESTGIPAVVSDIIFNLCRWTYLAVWQCERVIGRRFLPKWDNDVLSYIVCGLQLNVHNRIVVHYSTKTSMVFYKHSLALLFPCYKIHLFLQSRLASLDILWNVNVSMDLPYTGLRRLELVCSAALLQSDQYSHTFFFCTLPTENNIRTENFFLFPKQEVTYDQNSRGKKVSW